MFEKLDSCEFLSLAFPHRLSPNAFCLAMFIKEYHGGKIHDGAFYYDQDGSTLFTTIFHISENDFISAMKELRRSILIPESPNSLWLSIDENIF